jgi:hypothetical protein
MYGPNDLDWRDDPTDNVGLQKLQNHFFDVSALKCTRLVDFPLATCNVERTAFDLVASMYVTVQNTHLLPGAYKNDEDYFLNFNYVGGMPTKNALSLVPY